MSSLLQSKRGMLILQRRTRDNVKIDFQSNDDSTAYVIDDSDVEKVDFRIVDSFFYYIYQFNQFIWVPFLATILFISYHFNKEQFQELREVVRSPRGLKVVGVEIALLSSFFIVFVIWIFWPSPVPGHSYVSWILILIFSDFSCVVFMGSIQTRS